MTTAHALARNCNAQPIIQIGRYEFSGPFRQWTALRAESGVYAVLGGNGITKWQVLDIGEAENLRERVDSHERVQGWRACNHLMTVVAALYVPAPDRLIIKQELRAHYNPPCGGR